MRALVLSAVLGAGCSVEIAPGAYLCGPEQLCPEGQVCNGPDNTCVLPSSRMPFVCPIDELHPSDQDNTPETGQALGELACVSLAAEIEGCLDLGDGVDWFQFDTPSECTAIEVVARVEYPIAFQPVALRFTEDDSPGTVVSAACDSSSLEPGNDDRCFEMVLQPGRHYAVAAERSGTDCAGGCPYNRYLVSVRLKTP